MTAIFAPSGELDFETRRTDGISAITYYGGNEGIPPIVVVGSLAKEIEALGLPYETEKAATRDLVLPAINLGSVSLTSQS